MPDLERFLWDVEDVILLDPEDPEDGEPDEPDER